MASSSPSSSVAVVVLLLLVVATSLVHAHRSPSSTTESNNATNSNIKEALLLSETNLARVNTLQGRILDLAERLHQTLINEEDVKQKSQTMQRTLGQNKAQRQRAIVEEQKLVHEAARKEHEVEVADRVAADKMQLHALETNLELQVAKERAQRKASLDNMRRSNQNIRKQLPPVLQ